MPESTPAGVNLLGHLRNERGDGFGADVEIAEQLTVGDVRECFPGRRVRWPVLSAFRQSAFVGADGFVHAYRVDTTIMGRCKTVAAETEAEQETRNRIERDEVALVVIAVLEPR